MPLYLTSREWRELLGWFVRGVGSAAITRETGLHRQRVLRALIYARQAMAREVSPGFPKEAQFGAIYLGGQAEAKNRPQLPEQKPGGPEDPGTSSFAIVCNNGKVRIESISDAEAGRLLPLIPRGVREKSPSRLEARGSQAQTCYAEDAVGEDAVEARPAEESQINRLRGFWGYLKRQLAGRGGIRRERLPLYLAEYVWRYNHRQLSAERQIQQLMRLLRRSVRVGG